MSQDLHREDSVTRDPIATSQLIFCQPMSRRFLSTLSVLSLLISIVSHIMKKGQSYTIVVGLNPALQKRFVMDSSLFPGNVHRATSVQTGVGGKGQDVAVALSQLDFPCKLLQLVGLAGSSGKEFLRLLEERVGGETLQPLSIHTAGTLRTCTSLVTPHETTELVEPSAHVSLAEYNEMMERIATVPVKALCFMGSLPPGCPPDTYARIAALVCKTRDGKNEDTTLCVVDTVVGLTELLQTFCTKNCAAILKVNASELLLLAGMDPTCGSETDRASVDDVTKAIEELLRGKLPNCRECLEAIAITNGEHPALFACMSTMTVFEIQQPTSPHGQQSTLFPIGAGDAVAAGTLAAWQIYQEREETAAEGQFSQALYKHEPSALSSFCFGICCGFASCFKQENSLFDKDLVFELFSSMNRSTRVASLESTT